MIKFYIASQNPQFKCENPYFNTLHWNIVWRYFFPVNLFTVSKESDKEKTKDDEYKDTKEQENEEAWFG